MLTSLKDTFHSVGYTKAKSSFWRVKEGIFQLVDFQSGAHGKYFFVNVCVHPVGFPKLLSGRLEIPERPLEYECIIRQRIEQIGGSQVTDPFRKSLVSPDDIAAIEGIKEAVVTDIEPWMGRWGTCEAIARADRATIRQIVNAVPNLKERATAMLQYYCLVQIGQRDDARRLLSEFTDVPTGKWRLEQVDDYMVSLLEH